MILSAQDIDRNLLQIIEKCQVVEPATAPLFSVMYKCGVRVQEATNPRLWEISETGYIILTPQKFNDKRIFNITDIPESYRAFLKHSGNWLLKPNYSRLNYLYKLFTIYPTIYVGKKQCTNHLFRHNFVKKLLAQEKTPEEIRTILGERHLKSAMAYIDSEFSTVPQ